MRRNNNRTTLGEFLENVNSNRRQYGDMFMNFIGEQRTRMTIHFSEQPTIFFFMWDRRNRRWYLV